MAEALISEAMAHDTLREDVAVSDTKESSSASPLSKQKVATITACWLEDDAISLNGRQYPRETVDALIQSAQLKLSDAASSPLTCYVNHESSDQDETLKLIGRVTAVWKEGTRAMATIDIANTQAGRDSASLAANGYLSTLSLRASGAEISHEKGSAWPIVRGNPVLEGIDLTATPGIQVAKMHSVALAESHTTQNIQEVFHARPETMLVEQSHEQENTVSKSVQNAAQDIHETRTAEADTGGNTVGGYSPVSGTTDGVTSDPTQGSYGQRQYQAPSVSNPNEVSGLQEAHDRIAMVQSRSCAPTRESARGQAALKSIEEAGRKISKSNDAHLDAAHDAIAKHLGMECEGASNKRVQPADDGMQDGDDDDRESTRHHKNQKESVMTPEQAAKVLEAAGYSVQAPKSEAEQLKEQLAAMQAQFSELKEALFSQNQPAPQRKSLVSGATVPQSNKANVYTHGKYLREQMKGLDWEVLADRTAPLPSNIDLKLLINEFTDLRVIQNFDRYGWPENMYPSDRL